MDIKVNVENGVKTLELRTGSAMPVKEPVALKITGNIDAPSRFATMRSATLTQDTCHVTMDKENMIITLIVNETSAYSGTITGKLSFSKIFEEFGINTSKSRTTFELADFIKMNRSCFTSPNEAARLVMELNNFKAKIEKDVETADDRRGNRSALLRQMVQSNIPEKFNVCLPVFKGLPKQNVEVELYITPEFNCMLISPAAKEFIDTIVDDVMEMEKSIISNAVPNVVIIDI